MNLTMEDSHATNIEQSRTFSEQTQAAEVTSNSKDSGNSLHPIVGTSEKISPGLNRHFGRQEVITPQKQLSLISERES